ncbi:MAG: hypothetical protein HYV28_11900, partial [Ignavibacteriales bacterium]|nr:hypothetical protein [Ignavibacteriales bacterium]
MMKKILILLCALTAIPAFGMMQNAICPDTLNILLYTPPVRSGRVSDNYTIYPNKTTHIRFSVLKNAGAPDLPIILIHEFNNAQPDTVIGRMPDLL